MKNLIKITVISSLLVVACLLIAACGGDTEEFVQGKGEVDIYVTDNNTATPTKLANVTIEVREDDAQGKLIETHTNATDVNGFYQWVSPTAGVASDYHFTFILTGYVTQTATARPNLTGSNVRLDIKLAPASTTTLTITTASPLPAGTVGTAYTQTLAASSGTTPYTWVVAAGSILPAGLTLSTDGVISGTPTTTGTVSTDITVTDAAAATSTKSFSVTVNAVGVNAATLYQSSCAGCHSLGTVDTTGSPDLSKTTAVPTKYPTPGVAGHQGITLTAAEISALTAYFQAN